MNKLDLFKLLQNLVDNITTFLSLFYVLGLIDIDIVNNDSTNNSISNSTSTFKQLKKQENYIMFPIMTLFCTIFGLIRIINDFYNLMKFNTIVFVPEEASRGDYIGIFGEDLALLCIETIKRGIGIPINLIDLISSVFSSFSFAKECLLIMCAIIKFGITTLPQSENISQSCYIILFLIFVSVSGFYTLIRFIDLSVNNKVDNCGDMFLLYIVYMIVSSIHTCVFLDIVRDKD
jgi:hypothetical protein